MGAQAWAAGERADETATIRCIEAGLIPEGTLALYAIDPIARARRILGVVGVIFMAALAGQAVLQLGPPVVFGLAIALGLLGVRLSPTVDAADEGPRRPAVLVTATAILKREGGGFRIWMFAELVCAQLSMCAERMDLVLVGGDGSRAFIDCGALESGRQLIEAVASHLPLVML
jgi:hypothetical protein